MTRRSILLVASLTACTTLGLLAACGSSQTPAAPESSAPAAAPAKPAGPAPSYIHVGMTAFSWFDSDPPGVPDTDNPVLHRTAGGQGTFADPITAAISGDPGHMAYPAGTKMYVPGIQRYVIIEDSGQDPGPAGTQAGLSVWVDGRDGTQAAVEDCEDAVTGSGKVVAQLNPPPDEPVMAGPLFSNHVCHIPTPQ
jgi:hypothetical protein